MQQYEFHIWSELSKVILVKLLYQCHKIHVGNFIAKSFYHKENYILLFNDHFDFILALTVKYGWALITDIKLLFCNVLYFA